MVRTEHTPHTSFEHAPRVRYLEFFNQQLNPGQQRAVAPLTGTFVVRAGAGSGKTRVITSRMLHLMLCHQVPAHTIIALTFTNKAAREMKERMERFMPGTALPFINTFHAYCMRLLRQWGHAIGLAQFSLLDESDQEKICKQILERATLPPYIKITPSKLVGMISHHKNSPIGSTDPWLAQIITMYEREKKLAHCLDFDDLLGVCKNLLTYHPDVLQAIQNSLSHILVDEYQDTNVVQHELLKLLSLQPETQDLAVHSLCVVGDEDQSIYGWRGATIDNMLNFTKSFKNVEHILIDQNYRSTQPILQAANSVIRHNQRRTIKNLWSNRPGGTSVRVISCASSYQEAGWIAHMIQEYQRTFPTKSCAILYRSHYLSRSVEEALVRDNITYTIMGGVRFYDRQEIKDILAYTRCMVNPYDRVSLLRVLNTPARGLGTTTQEALLELWGQEPLADALAILTLFAKTVPERKAQALLRVRELIQLGDSTSNPHDLLKLLVTQTGWHTWLKDQYEAEEAQERFKNVQELLHAAQAAVQRSVTTLAGFLEEVALMQEDPRTSASPHQVVLMTLHAAKGLEFPFVVMCGVEETVLPSTMSLATPDGIEEERRLMYVGMTRAQDCLFITHAQHRATWGTMTSQLPSRFLSELPADTARETIALMTPMAMKAHARLWLTQAYALDTPTKPIPSEPAPARRNPIAPAPDIAITRTDPAKTSANCFVPGQRVRHAQFGTGTVQEVQTKSEHVLVTVRFSAGVKKLSGSFLTPMF
jgi:DNA helicase II / ATP-dependent DNA helicase PcrA